jgi:hypothetical protein
VAQWDWDFHTKISFGGPMSMEILDQIFFPQNQLWWPNGIGFPWISDQIFFPQQSESQATSD